MSDPLRLLKNTNYGVFQSVFFSILLLHLRNYKYFRNHALLQRPQPFLRPYGKR